MRAVALISLAALAACAQPQAEAPKAAAPAPEPAPQGPIVTAEGVNVIRVKAPIENEDALEALHCAAAQRARDAGAAALAWVGGVAKPKQTGGYEADLVYETAAAPDRAAERPDEGGAAPVEAWMIYCDEAGVPREGRA